MLLDHTAQGARTHKRIITLFSKPSDGVRAGLNLNLTLHQLTLKLHEEFLHNGTHDFRDQRIEIDNGVKPVTEFRRECLVDGTRGIILPHRIGKTHGRALQITGTSITGHDNDNISEINRFAILICQTTRIHHLQQNIENVRMGFFNFIKQQHRMGVLINRISKQSALVKTHISGRRTNKPRNRVAFHIFRHVKADEFNAQMTCQLAGYFCFAHAGRTRKQVIAHRLIWLTQAGTGCLHRLNQGINGITLPINNPFQGCFESFKHFRLTLGHALWRNPSNGGHNLFNFLNTNHLLAA